MLVAIQRLHTEASYEIAKAKKAIRAAADWEIAALVEAVRIEIHDLTLELKAKLKAAVEDLHRGFDLDVQYHADLFNTELLIEIARLTDWRNAQLAMFLAEAEDYLRQHRIQIDLEIELTIAGFNDEARRIIAAAHVRIQQETHAAIGRLELEHAQQVKGIAEKIRALRNPAMGGWVQRPGYCRRSHGSHVDTRDILKGARASDAVSCSAECKDEARCLAFFIGADEGCNMWVNEDIGHASEDDVEACFHLSDCYVWTGSGDDWISEPIGFAMGGYAIPDGYRDVCLHELEFDSNLWRQAKRHMNNVAVGGGYLNRVGDYVEKRENTWVSHEQKKGMSWLYVDADHPIHPDAMHSCAG